MRPIKGLVVGSGVIRCENGVTITDADIPKGIKWYDPVLVCYDFTTNTVVNIIPDGCEDSAESKVHHEPSQENVAVGEEDDAGGGFEFTGSEVL